MRRLSLALLALLLVATPAAAQTTVNAIPNATGAVGNWLLGAGADKVDAIDDAVGSPDGDTSYITINVSGQRQSYTFPSLGIPGGSTVSNVTLTASCRFVGTAASVRLNVRNEAASISEDSDQAVTGSYLPYTRVLTLNPFTAASWTVNEANTDGGTSNRLAEIELRSITPNTDIRCSQFFVSGTYTSSGGATVTRTLLLGVSQ